MDQTFEGSGKYWEARYAKGRTSGEGSYGELAQFKARVINDFVVKNNIQTVIEFGSGDGNQLQLAEYPQYIGYDISDTALRRCRRIFADDPTKTFYNTNDYDGRQADLVLSLDVIYHLVEDEVFDEYMRKLFQASSRYVLIYSSNEEKARPAAPHVRHRKFDTWIAENRPEFSLLIMLPNAYRGANKTNDGQTSPSDIYIYWRQ